MTCTEQQEKQPRLALTYHFSEPESALLVLSRSMCMPINMYIYAFYCWWKRYTFKYGAFRLCDILPPFPPPVDMSISLHNSKRKSNQAIIYRCELNFHRFVFFSLYVCVCVFQPCFFSQSPSTSVTYELIMHTMLPCVWHLKYFKISFCAKLPSFLIQSNITCEQSSSSTLDDVVRYMFVVRSGAQFNVIKFLYGRCMVMRDGYCSF